MNSGACSTMRAPDAACGHHPPLACGTLFTLAAVSLHPLPASAGRRPCHSGPSLPPGKHPIPAGSTQVAASSPGGGEPSSSVVARHPANPPEREPWSQNTTPSQSSTAFAGCLKRASPSRKSARSMGSRTDRRSGDGARATMRLPAACVRLARSAMTHSPKRAWPWLSLLPSLRLPTLKPLGSHSTLSGGSWASSRTHSATNLSSRGQ